MIVKSRYIKEDQIRRIDVKLQRKDFVKIFLTVIAAEMVAHFPISQRTAQKISESAERFNERMYNKSSDNQPKGQ